ncbi:MAG: ATP-binding protein [Myxococcota bacterium]|nr:ATP-binding protein [Myxococcota bacterium]
MVSLPDNRRILIVDDNPAIHQDFAKILAPPPAAVGDFDALEAELFDLAPVAPSSTAFELAFASQGAEALQLVAAAAQQGTPFALAFIDMRMPPGWDGLETIERLWQVDPSIQVVICSAYSDYTWADLSRRLGDRDSLLIVKKPFDIIEVTQCAHALTTKWNLAQKVRSHVEQLEQVVATRTAELVRANALLADEIRERDRIEQELRLSQRLRAIGQLAAGIAHEISTPIQFVADNLQFLREGFERVASHAELVCRRDGTLYPPEESAELAYLFEQLPGAFDTIEHGVSRVTGIVSSMREFAHPGSGDMAMADVNRALTNTLAVSAHSYRAIADVETHFGGLPLVRCQIGDLNQVFLNLIINAAHAMEGLPGRGTLGVATKLDGDHVVISISDTGCGIPAAIRDQIFDAFFTTKSLGRGTGQGLGVSRTIVVDRHGGTLTFDSAVGVGTTFHVRLPLAAALPRARSRELQPDDLDRAL